MQAEAASCMLRLIYHVVRISAMSWQAVRELFPGPVQFEFGTDRGEDRA